VGNLRFLASLAPYTSQHDASKSTANDGAADTTSDTTQRETPRNSGQP
jgi:hypothetical protein